jgi:hypothetical protein
VHYGHPDKPAERTDRDNVAALRLYASVGGDPGTREHVMFDFRL